VNSIPLAHDSYYLGRTEAFNTKIGLSSGDITGCCSLCDELTGLDAGVCWTMIGSL